MTRLRSDNMIGLIVLTIAVIIGFIWVPLDSETGLLEYVRRRYVIGDALAPTVAAVIMGVSGFGLLFSAAGDENGLDREAVQAGMYFLIVCSVSLGLMRYAGPVAIGVVDLFTGQDWTYRSLRGALPFRYIGFVIGGTVMISGLGWFMDGRISRRVLVRSFLIALAVGCCFDLPFEDIMLPPNGDV